MKLLTPQEALEQGYKSISTDINPISHVVKQAPRESFVRSLDHMLDGVISKKRYVESLDTMTDSRYGVSEADIVESMRGNMYGKDAAFIVFSPTRWQLARLNREVITIGNQPD